MLFYRKKFSRREMLHLGMKVATTALCTPFIPFPLAAKINEKKAPTYNVLKYGAVGDGKALDTVAIQKAINAAASVGKGARVLVPGGHQYLIGTLELKSNIDFHLEGDAELLVSTNKEHYSGEAAIVAHDAHKLMISGTGSINGRALEFMSHYDQENEWYIPAEWRPKLLVLTSCNDLEVRDISITKAPLWSLHMIGCEHVLIERIKIHNHLNVPNCDGIDPDHCRHVTIRNCHIVCGDDAIVIKATRQNENFGPSAHIRVSDCILETQDSGLKIGTETTQDIYDVIFERCEIISSCRGLTIQLRDEGNVFDVEFRDISFVSRYHSAPWWGRGEAISLTAIPRTLQTKVGSIHDIKFKNIKGIAENSARINGTEESHIRNITLENVSLTLDRWTSYPGQLFDNRPTKVYPEIEPHGTPGFYIRYADQVKLKNCQVKWGNNIPEYFTHALEAHDVTKLKLQNFSGKAAHPNLHQAVVIR